MLEKSFIEESLIDTLRSAETHLKEHYEDYVSAVESGIQRICSDLDSTENIAYINISYLYTHIINGNKDLLITAYDKDWYIGEVLYEKTLFMGDYFSVLDTFENTLYQESKKYYGAISSNELDKIKLEVTKLVGRYMIEFMRTVFRKENSRRLIKSINYNEHLTILAGEYLDHSDKLCSIDTREKNIDDIFFDIERGSECSNEYYTELSFKGLDASSKSFKRSWFNACRFKDIVFEETQFEGTTFVNCHFDNVHFNKSLLVSTFFRRCTFKECRFNNINEELVFDTRQLDSILHEKTAFVDCQFKGMDTSLIDFLGL